MSGKDTFFFHVPLLSNTLVPHLAVIRSNGMRAVDTLNVISVAATELKQASLKDLLLSLCSLCEAVCACTHFVKKTVFVFFRGRSQPDNLYLQRCHFSSSDFKSGTQGCTSVSLQLFLVLLLFGCLMT